MTEISGITRREFIQASALATTSVALTQATRIPNVLAAGEGTAGKYTPGPVFPYGAVYFRKSNPPEEDWARDHQTAAHLGMNIFRHWFMWSAVEVAPGKFDWSDYDRMMDLAAKNGI
jgi:beta-galactosidase